VVQEWIICNRRSRLSEKKSREHAHEGEAGKNGQPS